MEMNVGTTEIAMPAPQGETQTSNSQSQASQPAPANLNGPGQRLFKRPGLKKTQSDLCITGTGNAAKSIVPGQSYIENVFACKDLASTIEYLKIVESPACLEEARKERTEKKTIRRVFIEYMRERTRIRIARKEAAEKAEREARLNEADGSIEGNENCASAIENNGEKAAKEKSTTQDRGSIH